MAVLTAAVITKNEENNIRECLKLLSFCNEIIVVDDYSSDKTVDFAKKLGAKVYLNDSRGDFSLQRNFALQKAHNQWVLFVDADERIEKSLSEEIKNKMKKIENSAFKIKRQDLFLYKILRHGETANVEFVRLAKKESGKWKRPVHEVWAVEGKVSCLEGRIMHHPHKSLESFLDKINYYTEIEKKYRKSANAEVRFIQVILIPVLKFFYNYFISLGFVDGFHGLVMAYMMSLHSLILRVKVIRD